MKKAVFVTGGTIGTGYATAEKFAQAGYAVFISSREQARAQEAADKLAAQYGVFGKGYGLGIRDEEAVKAVFADIDELGYTVSTVVLNAADAAGYESQFPASMYWLSQYDADFNRRVWDGKVDIGALSYDRSLPIPGFNLIVR
jgi:NAD(P)-dependent dehydrogenase (short-subunit alcohol dehydrogenase family)